MKEILLYTDGACSGNPGAGGWAAILIYKKKIKKISGCQSDTTNNRMELMAAIKGLEALNEKCKVSLYTDSMYLKDGITKWIINWRKNNWRTSNKKPVKNMDLWQQLELVVQNHEVVWHWVKGHGEDKYNIMVDELAVLARNKTIEGS